MQKDIYAVEFKLIREGRICSEFEIRDSQGVADYWTWMKARCNWLEDGREHMVTILLNAKAGVMGHHLVSVGSVDRVTAEPRDILTPVLCSRAHGFILVHNHPSGDPNPSEADRDVTFRLEHAADILRVRFIDHIIVGDNEGTLFSFRQSGVLPEREEIIGLGSRK